MKTYKQLNIEPKIDEEVFIKYRKGGFKAKVIKIYKVLDGHRKSKKFMVEYIIVDIIQDVLRTPGSTSNLGGKIKDFKSKIQHGIYSLSEMCPMSETFKLKNKR